MWYIAEKSCFCIKTCFLNLHIFFVSLLIKTRYMRKHNTEKIGSILEYYLKVNGLDKKFEEREVKNIWPEVVGPLFARYTTRIEFERGVVFVSMSSAMARNELLMAKSKLVTSYNEKLGKKIVQDVIIR